MSTINQLVKQKRISKKTNLNKTPALKSNPQKHGTCISVFTKTPRKPNSALRKVAKVRLVNSKIINVFIPGEGHNISRFSDVLIVGKRVRDLPGIKYGALRGKFDLSGVKLKKNGRSKYGSKREIVEKLKEEKPKKQQQPYTYFMRRQLRLTFNKLYIKLIHKQLLDSDSFRYSYYYLCVFNRYTIFKLLYQARYGHYKIKHILFGAYFIREIKKNFKHPEISDKDIQMIGRDTQHIKNFYICKIGLFIIRHNYFKIFHYKTRLTFKYFLNLSKGHLYLNQYNFHIIKDPLSINSKLHEIAFFQSKVK